MQIVPFDYPLVIAFVLGLFSTLHCVGMCGSIMGALSLGLPRSVRESGGSLLLYVLLYNSGRLAMYVLLGFLAGFSGELLGQGMDEELWHLLARMLASITLIAVGLYITDWFPVVRRLDRLGAGVWRRVEPLGRRLLPVRTLPGAFGAGVVWGLLPCGLVYYALFMSLSSGGTIDSILFMLFFGLGTLPSMMTTGVMTGWLMRLIRRQYLRQAAGSVLILMGIIGLWWPAMGHYANISQ